MAAELDARRDVEQGDATRTTQRESRTYIAPEIILSPKGAPHVQARGRDHSVNGTQSTEKKQPENTNGTSKDSARLTCLSLGGRRGLLHECFRGQAAQNAAVSSSLPNLGGEQDQSMSQGRPTLPREGSNELLVDDSTSRAGVQKDKSHDEAYKEVCGRVDKFATDVILILSGLIVLTLAVLCKKPGQLWTFASFTGLLLAFSLCSAIYDIIKLLEDLKSPFKSGPRAVGLWLQMGRLVIVFVLAGMYLVLHTLYSCDGERISLTGPVMVTGPIIIGPSNHTGPANHTGLPL